MPKKQSTSVTKKAGKLSTAAAKVEEAIQSPKKGKKTATDSNLTPQKHRDEKNDSIARLSDAFEADRDEGIASLESKLDDEVVIRNNIRRRRNNIYETYCLSCYIIDRFFR